MLKSFRSKEAERNEENWNYLGQCSLSDVEAAVALSVDRPDASARGY